MKKNNLILSLSVFAFAVFTSCTKEQASGTRLTYELSTRNFSTIVSGSTTGANLVWTSGYASAVEIEFEAAKAGIEVEYKSEARQKINLFSPLSTLGIIFVPPGTYDDIEFEVEVQPNGSDAAFFLSGNFTNGMGITTPIIFRLNSALEIEAEKSNITIASGVSLNALTTLNLSMLTNTVTEAMLNNATRTNGVIEISATSNTGIYDIIYNNLKTCGGVEID
ncbi:MAG: hypothetical protein U1C70_03260 [Sediminibacterium sp.]|jgi:hypothetical protein|uniref:hypothetical protein n=1 Tax=Sediminibacterium sp. TaxID=1917865 RepID=UPI002ABB4622|nr:hypothetical protein [Sediminibacterium sp.]MDZ4070822.1 hypothetical protein [Sediminibacterium sp.]